MTAVSFVKTRLNTFELYFDQDTKEPITQYYTDHVTIITNVKKVITLMFDMPLLDAKYEKLNIELCVQYESLSDVKKVLKLKHTNVIYYSITDIEKEDDYNAIYTMNVSNKYITNDNDVIINITHNNNILHSQSSIGQPVTKKTTNGEAQIILCCLTSKFDNTKVMITCELHYKIINDVFNVVLLKLYPRSIDL